LKTLEEVISIVQNEVKEINYLGEPKELYEPMNYVLQLGGKRLRPVTVLLAANLFSDNISLAIPAAKAIEVFHNFTLVHDDIMDDAPLRRGKQTVHEKWNDNVAILSGDSLLIKSYDHFLEGNYKNLIEILTTFNTTAIEVCEGQQLDMNYETRSDVTIDDYIKMIRLKTSVLLGGAMKIGALLAESNSADAEHLYDFGVNIGLAFQLQDDYLDCFGDPEKFGKQIGGDIISNKKTFMMLKALELDSSGELNKWIEKESFNSSEKVVVVKELYKTLKVDDLASELMDEYYSKGLESLAAISIADEKKIMLKSFAAQLMKRSS
jgi:geranylgeranyl diphosphate synthase, type II